jgi:tetratricopeptide (TPR) repeat protein
MAEMIARPVADGDLSSARVVFTGGLASLSRCEATDIVQRAGGTVTSTVSRRTSMLVVGMRGWPLLEDGTVSRNLARAELLNERGADIAIISESMFAELAGLAPDRSPLNKTYGTEQVCQLLGLDRRSLQRWEALDLIRSANGRYDFQDIVSLRTIAGLIAQGVATQTIIRSVHGLAEVLPGTQRPLAQLQIVEESGDLLAEMEDAFVAPDGQLILNFDPRQQAPVEVLPLSVEDDQEPDSPEALFQRGRDNELEEHFQRAVEAYRRALALRPRFPEAHVSLANALRAMGRLEAAQEHLLLAVGQAPSLAAAWYNLADILEEQGDMDQAIDSLQAAIEQDPTFADAHYDLALYCEETGRVEEARRHWRTYLKLDPSSPWADMARRYLEVEGQSEH